MKRGGGGTAPTPEIDQTDKQTDRQTDRQTDIDIGIHIDLYLARANLPRHTLEALKRLPHRC